MRSSRYDTEQFSVPTPPEIYNYRVYVLAVVASFGAFIFGYDLAFIGTTLALDSFQRYPLSQTRQRVTLCSDR